MGGGGGCTKTEKEKGKPRNRRVPHVCVCVEGGDINVVFTAGEMAQVDRAQQTGHRRPVDDNNTPGVASKQFCRRSSWYERVAHQSRGTFVADCRTKTDENDEDRKNCLPFLSIRRTYTHARTFAHTHTHTLERTYTRVVSRRAHARVCGIVVDVES